MVCWLALCLGRKAEERLGKSVKEPQEGGKGGIREGKGSEGGGRVTARELKSF